MSAQPQHGEVCPNCGDFAFLNDTTGWCFKCSPPVNRVERWLTKYADKIEITMLEERCNARQAIEILLSRYKAICIVCKEVIPHGTFGRHFMCTRHPECRKVRRRYKYFIYEKGLSKKDALERAIRPGV